MSYSLPVPLSPFARAALGTLLWSECDEDGSPLLEDAPGTHYETGQDVPCEDYEWDPEGLAEFALECDAFLRDLGAESLLEALPEDSHAHNFILSRNGHGAGYWDLGLDETGTRLHRMTKPYGTVGLYRGGDGTIYFHG